MPDQGLACCTTKDKLDLHALLRHVVKGQLVKRKSSASSRLDTGFGLASQRQHAYLESGHDVKMLLHVCAQHHVDAGAAQLCQLI